MAQGYTDNYASTLGSGYTSGATSLIVASASGLPASGLVFFLVVAAEGANTTEVFKCTSYSGTTLTVVGAQANTSASNHASGAAITGCYITAGALDGIRSDQSQRGVYASLPVSGMKKGDRYICTDSVYEFWYDGSAWQPFIAGQPSLILIPSAGWSWDNQGSSTTDNSHGYETSTFLNAGATNARMRYRTAPATPYTITGLFRMDLTGQYRTAGTECGFQFGFRDGTGKIATWTLQTTAGTAQAGILKWTSSTSFNSTYNTLSGANAAMLAGLFGFMPLWLRIADDGVNLTWSCSLNGIDWQQFDQRSRTNFFGSGPTQIGYGAYVGNGSVTVDVLSWG